MTLLESAAFRTANFLGRKSWLTRRMRSLYEHALDWSSGGQGIPWSINETTCRVSPYYRHQMAREYDQEVIPYLRSKVKPGDICFDVGANVGVYVLQLAHWSQPNGRVVAFEPNPEAYGILEKHIRINGIGERVDLVHAAVGSAPGQATLYTAGTDGQSRLGAPNGAIHEQAIPIVVPIVTLDDFTSAQGILPNWMLIDIEGFEIEALRGARSLITSQKGTLEIFVEMHPNVWATANTTRESAQDTLNDLGLVPIPLSGQNDSLEDYGLVHLVYQ